MIFVLKFGAWRMSVFATDRRYSVKAIMYDNISFVIACGLSHINNIYVIIYFSVFLYQLLFQFGSPLAVFLPAQLGFIARYSPAVCNQTISRFIVTVEATTGDFLA